MKQNLPLALTTHSFTSYSCPVFPPPSLRNYVLRFLFLSPCPSLSFSVLCISLAFLSLNADNDSIKRFCDPLKGPQPTTNATVSKS